MIKFTHTITFTGQSKQEFNEILAHLEKLSEAFPEWVVNSNELLNQVTACKSQEVESL
jgi:hypothetical protein